MLEEIVEILRKYPNVRIHFIYHELKEKPNNADQLYWCINKLMDKGRIRVSQEHKVSLFKLYDLTEKERSKI